MNRKKDQIPVLGFSGFSGSGKTTLIEKIIPLLKNRGYRVGVIKHDAHDFEMDREGKDTYRFTKAGADSVLISSDHKSAMLNKRSMSYEDMISYLRDVDIIMAEGYKYADIPKIGVTRKQIGYSLAGEPGIYRALACDDITRFDNVKDIPVYDLNDVVGISEWIIRDIMGYEKDAGNDMEFTHFDREGNARMVNVSDKDVTIREARAEARVLVNEDTFRLIKEGSISKGDVLTVAQVAGIMGAKKTPELIPMCHPVVIDGADVKLILNEEETAIDIEAAVRCTGRTGVEMEALCACSAAALTVYDMCKAVQRDIVITDIRLNKKTGGVHGDYIREKAGNISENDGL